jgi:hypothetical protein
MRSWATASSAVSKSLNGSRRSLLGHAGLGGLGFTRRCQCGPCDLNGLCDSLFDLDARLFGVVPPLKHERKNGLRTLVEDVEAIARLGIPMTSLTVQFL